MQQGKTPFTFGFDIGGTMIKSVVWDVAQGKVVAEDRFVSRAATGVEPVLEGLAAGFENFQKLGFAAGAVGIACAGSIDSRQGVVRSSPNFQGWHDVPLREAMQGRWRVPVTVENDANAATMAEWKLGEFHEARQMVLLTLGTGIGGGLIVDGRLFRGATGTAGELGHMSIRADGEPCPCGARGCFERYASGSALGRRAGGVSPKEVLARTDGKYAVLVDAYLEDLATGMANICNVFDPEAMVLGGAVSEGLARFLPVLEEKVRVRIFPSIAVQLRVGLARMGTFGGAMGAALTAVEVQ